MIAIPAAVLALSAATFFYYHLASTIPLDGGRAPFVQQARDFLDGNWSLRGWSIGQDSYLLTELPLYILAVAIRGERPSVVVDVSAIFYTVLVAVVAVTAAAASYRGSRWLSALIAFALVAVPSIPVGVYSVISGPFHGGTALFILCTALAIHWSHQRFKVALSIVAFVLMAANVASDPLALYAGALPIILVYGARVASSAPRPNLDTLRATLIAVLGALAGAGLQKYGARLLGITIFQYPTGGYNFATVNAIPNNIGVALVGWLKIFNGDFTGQPVGRHSLEHLFHSVGYAFVAISCVYVIVASVQAARRPDAESRGTGSPLILWQVLLGVIICNVAAVVLTTVLVGAGASATRYLAPAAFAGGTLAGAVGPALLPRVRWRLVAASIAIVYIAFLPLVFRYPSAPPQPHEALAQWLEANHLHHGFAEYFSSGTTSVASDGQVQVLPVSGATGRIGPIDALTNTSWFDGHRYANFVVIDHAVLGGPDCCVDEPTALRTFGPPARVVNYDGYTIMVWDHNIFPSLSRQGVI